MTDRLKIGQEVLIHGYVDEIRKDTVIVRNEGGYFGTVECEITDIEMPYTNDVLDKIRAEIEEQKECRCFDDDEMLVYRTGLDDALYIIDKYTDSEESNDERRSNTYS